MECLMFTLAPNELTLSLSETNARLRLLLDSLNPAPDQRPALVRSVPPEAAPLRVATPQQMAGLLSELMRAGGCLRSLPAERDTALEEEVGEYRQNVERLRALLPSIHGALLQERSRLEQERARVRRAADWAKLSQQTL
jgi:hypothetical protein